MVNFRILATRLHDPRAAILDQKTSDSAIISLDLLESRIPRNLDVSVTIEKHSIPKSKFNDNHKKKWGKNGRPDKSNNGHSNDRTLNIFCLHCCSNIRPVFGTMKIIGGSQGDCWGGSLLWERFC